LKILAKIGPVDFEITDLTGIEALKMNKEINKKQKQNIQPPSLLSAAGWAKLERHSVERGGSVHEVQWFIIILCLPRGPGTWLSSRIASTYSGLELVARQWTDQYSLQNGDLI